MYGRIAYMSTVVSHQVSYYNNFHEPRNLLLAIARWRCIMEGVGGGGVVIFGLVVTEEWCVGLCF